MTSLEIRPDSGVYPGFVGLKGRDVRTGGPPDSFSNRPPSNPGYLNDAPDKLPSGQFPIPGTTTQPTVNGSTTLTRIVEPYYQEDWDKINTMVEGDLVFIARPDTNLMASTGEDLADICTLAYLNNELAKPTNFLDENDFILRDYIDRGNTIQQIISKRDGNDVSQLETRRNLAKSFIDLEQDFETRKPNHPLAMYILDGVARVVDPEGTNSYGKLRTPLVYNVVAQGCCTVNNCAQMCKGPDGNMQFVSEQLFDVKPEMNSILYLALTVTKQTAGTKWRAEYKCISNTNLRRTAFVNKQENATTPYKLDFEMMQRGTITKEKLNRQPRLRAIKKNRQGETGVTTENANTYTETLTTIGSTIQIWRVGRIIDARVQPMSTSVLTSFSPAVEVNVDIYRVPLPAFVDIKLNGLYLPFQSKYGPNTSIQSLVNDKIRMAKQNKKDFFDQSSKPVYKLNGKRERMRIGIMYDDDEDPLDMSVDTNDNTTPVVAQDPFDAVAAQALVNVQRTWIALLQAAIPPMARPQFEAMVADYSKKIDALPQIKDVDDLKKTYEHLCARARDSIEGSPQSARLNSTRLKQAYEASDKPPLHLRAIEDVYSALETSITELEKMTTRSVHKAQKDQSPSEEQKLDLSSFCSINNRTDQLISAVHNLSCCAEHEFKEKYDQLCNELKLKKLPLEDTIYTTTNASTTYTTAYSTPIGGSSSNASNASNASNTSDDDDFFRVDTGNKTSAEKPRKRAPPRPSKDK